MYILAQQAVSTAQSIRELSQAASRDVLVSGTPGAFDMTLIALGVVVVTVTTIYSVLYLLDVGSASRPARASGSMAAQGQSSIPRPPLAATSPSPRAGSGMDQAVDHTRSRRRRVQAAA
jgi:hypothetical protein